jgi:OmpA-OmpF porin, OOP family
MGSATVSRRPTSRKGTQELLRAGWVTTSLLAMSGCAAWSESAERASGTAPAPPCLSLMPYTYVVAFDFDSARINEDGRNVIGEAAAKAMATSHGHLEDIAISVTGHADRVGPDDYNLSLSLRRAEAVRDALLDAGIPAIAITIARRGEDEPLVPTPDGVPEPANRRVEIIISP